MLHARLVTVVVAALVAFGCSGGSPSSPSSSSSSTSSSSSGPVASVYFGTVSLSDGRSGSLMVRASSTLTASISPPSALGRRLLAILEVPLLAQSAASGAVIFNDGSVAELTGTSSGSRFTLSGGGYNLTVTVAGTAVSGTGTGPGGVSATVSPSSAPVASVPSSPEGTYRGSYSIQAPARYTISLNSNGTLVQNCTYNAIISGTLALLVRSDPGHYYAHLTTTWTETNGPPGSCPFNRIQSPVSPAGPSGLDYSGPATTLQFATYERGIVSSGAQVTRTETFAGAFSGSTIAGRVSFSFEATGNDGSSQATDSYPLTGVDVVLVKGP